MIPKEPLSAQYVSANRLNQLLTCGVAFKYRYVDDLPEQVSGSAALFGSVLHEALAAWTPDRRANSLIDLVRKAWVDLTTGTEVAGFLADYAPLSREAIGLEREILTRRPEIKVPRMTNDWKKSKIAADIQALVKHWLPQLESSPWRFTERDPLPSLFDQSLVLAFDYGKRTQGYPNSYITELDFLVPFAGFQLKGYIDSIEPLVQSTGEMIGTAIVDYKSYGKEPAEHKDYRQLAFYYAAVTYLSTISDYGFLKPPFYVGVDYLRLGYRRFWEFGPEDLRRLEKELGFYKVMVENEIFFPAAKGVNADFCSFPENCCLTTTNGAGGQADRVVVPGVTQDV